MIRKFGGLMYDFIDGLKINRLDGLNPVRPSSASTEANIDDRS